MEECYYSHFILWHYFQLTKSGYFQILGKRKGQWKNIFKIQINVDPVKYCKTFNAVGCSHVDGYLCDMDTCKFNTIENLKKVD